ncbi:MAG: helix-hairpin-helix domain-containing protein [Bacteroidales bacterium]
MSNKWKDILAFTTREKRGVIVLVILLLLLISIKVWSPWNQDEDEMYDFSGYESEINRFEMKLAAEESADQTYHQQKSGQNDYSPDYNKELFGFDPNTASRQELMELGFTERLADNIMNYRKAGGYFSEKYDLKKIYGMPEKLYHRLEPYISISSADEKEKEEEEHEAFFFDPNRIGKDSLLLLGFKNGVAERWVKYREASGGFDSITDIKRLYGIDNDLLEKLEPFMQFEQKKEKHRDTQDEKSPVDINTAGFRELMELDIISKKLAGQILSYRDLLGGYTDTEQLKEVYDISQENYQLLKKWVVVDPEQITTINLNEADFGTLLRHPYLSKADVKNIMKFRDHTGEIDSLSQLQQNNILKDTTYQKISPYLSLH